MATKTKKTTSKTGKKATTKKSSMMNTKPAKAVKKTAGKVVKKTKEVLGEMLEGAAVGAVKGATEAVTPENKGKASGNKSK